MFDLDIRFLAASFDRVMLLNSNGTNFEVIATDDKYDYKYVAHHETKNYIYWTGWSGNITRLVSTCFTSQFLVITPTVLIQWTNAHIFKPFTIL